MVLQSAHLHSNYIKTALNTKVAQAVNQPYPSMRVDFLLARTENET